MQRPVVLGVFAMLGALAVFAPGRASTQQTTPAAQTPAPERARLLELQRAAVGHVQQAARSGAPVDEIRRALTDASRDLDALGAEPDRRGAAESAPAPLLPAPLRADLRRAAADLTALAPGDMHGSRCRDEADPRAARQGPNATRGRSCAGAHLRRQLQPDQAQGARLRRPRVRDGSCTGQHDVT